jgi:hypothetical protein
MEMAKYSKNGTAPTYKKSNLKSRRYKIFRNKVRKAIISRVK